MTDACNARQGQILKLFGVSFKTEHYVCPKSGFISDGSKYNMVET